MRVEINEVVLRRAGDTSQLVTVPGATVTIRKPNGVTATIYTSPTGAGTKANPLTADNNGRIEGYVDPGHYEITVSGTGITSYTQPFQAVRADGIVVAPFPSGDTTGVTDRANIQAALDAAHGSGTLLGVLRFPNTDDEYVINAPLSYGNVAIRGGARGTKIKAFSGFSGGSHMLRNWVTSDYAGGESDTTIAPGDTATPVYHARIDGLYLDLNQVANLRGIGFVHPHETSVISNVSFDRPGSNGVAIHLDGNSDSSGVVNGQVVIEKITCYATSGTWKHELLEEAGGSDLLIRDWTTAPNAHSASPFDLGLNMPTFENCHIEAHVDPASVANTDLAVIRLRDSTNVTIRGGFCGLSTGITAKHPFVYITNSNSSGFARSSPTIDSLAVSMTNGSSWDAAIPFIKDRAQSANQQDVFLGDKSRIHRYDGNQVVYMNSSTGLNVVDQIRVLTPTVIAPTLLNSWVNYGGGVEQEAGYWRDPFGMVHIRGKIKNGTLGAAAFQLPVGYRPAMVETVTGNDGNGTGQYVVIDASGNVKPSGGNNAAYSLTGISFLAGV